MEKFFEFKKYGTNYRTETIAGVTTFFAMAYILFVNPAILSLTGMDYNAVFVATIICSVIGTLFMALFANVPYALAPGMGLNAFFTFTVCFAMGFTWQQGLGLVLICGIVNTLITVTGLRKEIINAMPRTLQSAIAGGIGMFIAYIGLKNGGLLKFTADAPFLAVIPNGVQSDQLADQIGTVVASSAAVPALVNFSSAGVQLTLIGLVLMIILLVRKVKGAIIIGIAVTTIIGIFMGIVDVSRASINPASFVATVSSLKLTFLQIDILGLFATPAKTLLAITAAVAFCLTDIFDCIGTFIGTGRKTGIFNEKDEQLSNKTKGGLNFSSRMDKALFADLVATTTGAFFGTSNTTTYVESAAGISAGGKTGFASVVTAALFALSIFLAPIAGLVPAQATAPALIVVGVMMMSAFSDIKWGDFDEAVPAFLTSVLMPLTYGITNGIAFGFISFALIHMLKGKGKNVSIIIYGICILFIINFILQAFYHI